MEKFRSFISSSLKSYFDTNGFAAEAAKLHDDGVSPESEQGQDFAKRFWNWMMQLTGGDMVMV